MLLNYSLSSDFIYSNTTIQYHEDSSKIGLELCLHQHHHSSSSSSPASFYLPTLLHLNEERPLKLDLD